jgi:hypothetical protein
LPGFCVLRSASMKMNWSGAAAQTAKESEKCYKGYKVTRLQGYKVRMLRVILSPF